SWQVRRTTICRRRPYPAFAPRKSLDTAGSDDPPRLVRRNDRRDVRGPAERAVMPGGADDAFQVVAAGARSPQKTLDQDLVAIGLDHDNLPQHVGGRGRALVLEIDQAA